MAVSTPSLTTARLTLLDFHLPFLSFSTATLSLIDWSEAAAEVLGEQWTDGRVPALSAIKLLGRGGERESDEKAKENARKTLEGLLEQSKGLRWDQGAVVELYGNRATEGKRMEVRVVSTSTQNGAAQAYSILFLRPALPPQRLPLSSTPSSSSSRSEHTNAPPLSNPSLAEPPPTPSPTSSSLSPPFRQTLKNIVAPFVKTAATASDQARTDASSSPSTSVPPPPEVLEALVQVAPTILCMLNPEGRLSVIEYRYSPRPR
jgi:hypothetical protein